MNHIAEPVSFKQVACKKPIRKIGLHEIEARIIGQHAEARALEGRIVVFVKAVDAYDDAPALQQSANHMKSDKAGRASDQCYVICHYLPIGSST